MRYRFTKINVAQGIAGAEFNENTCWQTVFVLCCDFNWLESVFGREAQH